jgi:hypothetical protein
MSNSKQNIEAISDKLKFGLRTFNAHEQTMKNGFEVKTGSA